jgi:NAD-dependent SIR2 family protein deacetylase
VSEQGEAVAGAPGCVFIVRGDVLALACDAVVLPTDDGRHIEGHWRAHLDSLVGLEVRGGRFEVLHGRSARSPGVWGPFVPSGEAGGDGHQTWLVSTAVLEGEGVVTEDDPRWDAALGRLGQVLDGFARAFAASPRRSFDRERPLIAVPLFGSGAGGFRRSFRRYARELIALLGRCAEEAGADVVLVIHGRQQRATALEALCRVERRAVGLAPNPEQLAGAWRTGLAAEASDDLGGSAEDVITRLVKNAVAGELVPFIGAGVSRSGGALDWEALIRELEAEAGLGGANLESLDLLARAQIVANRLGDDQLVAAIDRALSGTRVSLQHALLAALRVRDAITTNFDDAYERAVRDAGGDVAVVPGRGSPQRLLKLHGSLASSEDGGPGTPILTRDQYLEHAQRGGPLRGALQMMLLTGHVVFIGYSLNDPDLHAAIHEVRRIREVANLAHEPLATALQVVASPQLGLLWSPVVDVVWPGSGAAVGEAPAPIRARDLEILLDALADATALAEVPVLAFDESELAGDELVLREKLETLAVCFERRQMPRRIEELLEAYGLGLAPDQLDGVRGG